MGFRINTNVAALSAHANASMNNRAIDSSLSKLNSGFRINSAADDASGMAIADSLRSQASSLGKAIMNANDAIGIIQTADKAMDEQIKILETIKNKAIQSAQDGQTTETRKALQADISRLMEELDNIGNTTSFNGQKLLSGTFSNKEFQIGAYSNETVKASIGATTSDKIGLTRFETGHNVRASDVGVVKPSDDPTVAPQLSDGKISITFKNVDGINDVTLEPVAMFNSVKNEIKYKNPLLTGADLNDPANIEKYKQKFDIKTGQGLGALAEAINKASDKTGVRASVTTETVFEQTIKAGTTGKSFSINGVKIGSVEVQDKDANGALRAAINSVKDQTGVEASVDSNGRLVLNNRDGRGIQITEDPNPTEINTYLADAKNKINDAFKSANKAAGANTDAAITFTASTANAAASAAYGVGTQGATGITVEGNMQWKAETANGKNDGTWDADNDKIQLLTAAAWTTQATQTAQNTAQNDILISEKATGKTLNNASKIVEDVKNQIGAAKALADIENILAGKAATGATATAMGAATAPAAGAPGNATGAGATSLDDLKKAYEKAIADIEKSDAYKKFGAAGPKDGVGGTTPTNNTEMAAATTAVKDYYAAKQNLAELKGGLAQINDAMKEVGEGMKSIVGMNETNATNFGRLSFVSNNGKDIVVEAKDMAGNDMTKAIGYDMNVSQKTVSLRETQGSIDKEVADAMGFNSNEWQAGPNGDNKNGYAAGVMTFKGAQAMMNIAESAQKALEAIRSDLGSVQNQLVSTVNNISVTQVNVKAAESNIRDVDFAEESATFSKHQILAQSGVYAMSQANAVQQNVMRLLQ